MTVQSNEGREPRPAPTLGLAVLTHTAIQKHSNVAIQKAPLPILGEGLEQGLKGPTQGSGPYITPATIPIFPTLHKPLSTQTLTAQNPPVYF